MNIGEKRGFYEFARDNDLIAIVPQFNLSAAFDTTYLRGSKRIISHNIVEFSIKVGHHRLWQHIISDHSGVYLHFRVEDLVGTTTMDLESDGIQEA